MKNSGKLPKAELECKSMKFSLIIGIILTGLIFSATSFAVNICPLDKTPTEITIQHSRHPANIPIGIYDNTIDITIKLDAVQRETGERTPLANKELLLELTIGSKFITKSGTSFVLSDEQAPFPVNTSENGTIHFTIYTQQPLLNDSVSPKKISYAITASYVPKPKEPLLGSAKTERYVPGVFPIISMSACLPLFIVVGLLVAAMFATGKNPFGLFDFTRVAFKAPTIARKQVTTRVKSNVLTNVAAGVAKARLKMLSYNIGNALVKYSDKVKESGKKGITAKLAGFVTGTAGRAARKAGTRKITQKEKLAMAKEKVKSGSAESLGQALKQVKQRLKETGGGRQIDIATSKGEFRKVLAGIIASAISQMGYRPWSLSAARAPTPNKTYSKKEQKEMEDKIKDSINWTKVAEKLGIDEQEAKNKIKADGRGLTPEAKLLLGRISGALKPSEMYIQNYEKFNSTIKTALNGISIEKIDSKIKEAQDAKSKTDKVSQKSELQGLVNSLTSLKKAIASGNWDKAMSAINEGMKQENRLTGAGLIKGELLIGKEGIKAGMDALVGAAMNPLAKNLEGIRDSYKKNIEEIKQKEGEKISTETREKLERERKTYEGELSKINGMLDNINSNEWSDIGKSLTAKYNEAVAESLKLPNDRMPIISTDETIRLVNEGVLKGVNYTYKQELDNMKEAMEAQGSTLNNLAKLYGVDTQLLTYLEKGDASSLREAITKLKDNPEGMAIAAMILNGPGAGYIGQAYGNKADFEKLLNTNLTTQENQKALTGKVVDAKIKEWGEKMPPELTKQMERIGINNISGDTLEQKITNFITLNIPAQEASLQNERDKVEKLRAEYESIPTANFADRAAKRKEIESQEFKVSTAEGDLYRMEKSVRDILNTRETITALRYINEVTKDSNSPNGAMHPSTIYNEAVAENAAWLRTYGDTAKEYKATAEKTNDELVTEINQRINKIENSFEKLSGTTAIPGEVEQSLSELIKMRDGLKTSEVRGFTSVEDISSERNQLRDLIKEIDKKTDDVSKNITDMVKSRGVVPQEERTIYAAIQTTMEEIDKQGRTAIKEIDKAAGTFIDKNAYNPIQLNEVSISNFSSPDKSIDEITKAFGEGGRYENKHLNNGIINQYLSDAGAQVPQDVSKGTETQSQRFVINFFGGEGAVPGTAETKPTKLVGTGELKQSGPTAEPPVGTTPAEKFKPPKEAAAPVKKEEPKIELKSPDYEKSSFEIESQMGGSKVTKEQKGELSWAEDQKKRDEEAERRRLEFERKVKETATAAKEKVTDTAKSYKEDVTTIWEWAKSKVKKEKEESK